MSYYYLQVKRLDGESACAFFYPLGTEASKLPDRVGERLDKYRAMGFQIIHQYNDPYSKQARRKQDGVQLELLVVEQDRPISIALNVELNGGDDEQPHPTTLH